MNKHKLTALHAASTTCILQKRIMSPTWNW